MRMFTACCVGLVVGALSMVGFGCSSSSSSGGSRSGVTESKKLADLTPTDKQQLCDWSAAQEGGYGHKRTQSCGDAGTSSESAPASQAACVNGLNVPQGCPVTVSQAEDCIAALATVDLCSDTLPASCAPLFATSCQTQQPADAGTD